MANMDGKRLMNEKDACEYISMSRSKCRSWAAEIGAVRHIGRRVLYDRNVIDRELDSMKADAAAAN